MNRTDFFKQIGAYGAGIATALTTKLSVIPKDEMKVTDNVQYQDKNGNFYNFVVVPCTPGEKSTNTSTSRLITIHGAGDEVRDLNV